MNKKLTMRICVFTLMCITFFNSFGQDLCEEPQSRRGKSKYEEAMGFIAKASDPACRTPDFFYNQAFPLLREVEKSDPEFAGTYYYLGIVYTFRKEKRNLTAAKRYFEKTIDLCPDFNIDVHYHLANIAFGAGEFEETIQQIDKYLAFQAQIDNDEYLVYAKMLKNDAVEKRDLFSTTVPFNPVVVKGISSKFSEYLVIISPDNELAFYTRQQPISDKLSAYASDAGFAEKFFMSERMSNGEFDAGREMGAPFNRRQNEGGATLTIDNRELFYTVCEWTMCSQRNERYYNCDIYYTRKEFGNWIEIEPLSGNVNTPCYWESMPSISSDGQTLYFTSDRPGGFGGYDLYESNRKPDGTWTEPVNLGAKINTPGNEKTPFIHTDSQTLYFSSDGRPGMGGYDIYFSKKMDNGTWTEPKNIGYPINTQYDDIGFIVSTDGRYGYFSSDRLGLGPGGSDFYSFELYEAARPEKVLFIKGDITDDKTNTPVEARVELRNLDTKVIHHIPVDSETGKYVVALPFKSDYVLTVKKEDYVYESMYISAEDSVYDGPTQVDMELQAVEVGRSYKLNDIFYEYDSDELTKQSKLVLEEFLVFLKENPRIKVAINGHTDNVGGAEYNRNLSERRAKSVYDYLVAHGVQSSRLSFKGFGFAQPVASNETEEGRALNRRTEFVITEK
jgi:outer membrane protein OmpA-like peptidoglycan-associated protein/tetratricopeptide (TPR) repeat protein